MYKTNCKTIQEAMASTDWRDRFIGEYNYISKNSLKLHITCTKYAAGTLKFTPNCSLELLLMQLNAIDNYLNVLKIRAFKENINLHLKNEYEETK